MATTKLTDVNFQSEVFKTTLEAAFTDKLVMLNSGIAVPIPDTVISPNEQGYLASIPRWNTLSGTPTQITSVSAAPTPGSITDIKDTAAWMEREIAFGTDTIVNMIAGKDPTQEIARQLGTFWATKLHYSIMSTLNGVMASALASTHVYSDSATSTITKEHAIRAKQKLGDAMNMLTLCAMNSSVYTDATIAQLLTEGGYADQLSQTGDLKYLVGSRVFVSDELTATDGVYPTYFAAPGAVEFKFRNRTTSTHNNEKIFNINAGNLNIEVEIYRSQEAGGKDILVSRTSYLTHVPGVQFDTTVTSNPSDTELATGTTWTKVQTDKKLIPLIQMQTK